MRLKTILAAALLSLMLTNCASKPEAPVTSLPAPPSFAEPVSLSKVKLGDDLRSVAARRTQNAKSANRIITEFVSWYNNVKANFEGKSGI